MAADRKRYRQARTMGCDELFRIPAYEAWNDKGKDQYNPSKRKEPTYDAHFGVIGVTSDSGDII
jgi:hypothetical protein